MEKKNATAAAQASNASAWVSATMRGDIQNRWGMVLMSGWGSGHGIGEAGPRARVTPVCICTSLSHGHSGPYTGPQSIQPTPCSTQGVAGCRWSTSA